MQIRRTENKSPEAVGFSTKFRLQDAQTGDDVLFFKLVSGFIVTVVETTDC